MKTTMKRLYVSLMLMAMFSLPVLAQVTPTTPDVKLFCDGSTLDLGTPPVGTDWIVRYSTTPTDTPTEGIVLNGNIISAADLNSGYYYIISKGTDAGACESEMQEVPVYKFAALAVDFTAPTSYCIEDVASQEFTGSATSTDSYTSLAYQWYTVNAGVETAISGATSITYKPSETVTPGTETTYRLKAGYLVDGLRYCSAIVDKAISVTVKPAKPTITISGVTGEAL